MPSALTIQQFEAFAGPRFQGTYLSKVLQLTSGGAFNKRNPSFSSAPGPTSAYGIDLVHADIVTLDASATRSYDLTALIDVAGVTRSWARIKYLWFFLPGLDDAAGNTVQTDFLTLGGGATNPHAMWLGAGTHKYKVKGGDTLEKADYSALGEVVDATHKTFDVINTAVADATYAIILGGCLT